MARFRLAFTFRLLGAALLIQGSSLPAYATSASLELEAARRHEKALQEKRDMELQERARALSPRFGSLLQAKWTKPVEKPTWTLYPVAGELEELLRKTEEPAWERLAGKEPAFFTGLGRLYADERYASDLPALPFVIRKLVGRVTLEQEKQAASEEAARLRSGGSLSGEERERLQALEERIVDLRSSIERVRGASGAGDLEGAETDLARIMAGAQGAAAVQAPGPGASRQAPLKEIPAASQAGQEEAAQLRQGAMRVERTLRALLKLCASPTLLGTKSIPPQHYCKDAASLTAGYLTSVQDAGELGRWIARAENFLAATLTLAPEKEAAGPAGPESAFAPLLKVLVYIDHVVSKAVHGLEAGGTVMSGPALKATALAMESGASILRRAGLEGLAAQAEGAASAFRQLALASTPHAAATLMQDPTVKDPKAVFQAFSFEVQQALHDVALARSVHRWGWAFPAAVYFGRANTALSVDETVREIRGGAGGMQGAVRDSTELAAEAFSEDRPLAGAVGLVAPLAKFAAEFSLGWAAGEGAVKGATAAASRTAKAVRNLDRAADSRFAAWLEDIRGEFPPLHVRPEESRLVVGGGRGPGMPQLRPSDHSINIIAADDPHFIMDLGRSRFPDDFYHVVYVEYVDFTAFSGRNIGAIDELVRFAGPGGKLDIITGLAPEAEIVAALERAGMKNVRVMRTRDGIGTRFLADKPPRASGSGMRGAKSPAPAGTAGARSPPSARPSTLLPPDWRATLPLERPFHIPAETWHKAIQKVESLARKGNKGADAEAASLLAHLQRCVVDREYKILTNPGMKLKNAQGQVIGEIDLIVRPARGAPPEIIEVSIGRDVNTILQKGSRKQRQFEARLIKAKSERSTLAIEADLSLVEPKAAAEYERLAREAGVPFELREIPPLPLAPRDMRAVRQGLSRP